MKKVDKLKNFLTSRSYDYDQEPDSGKFNDLSMSYRKKIDIIKDILRSQFHDRSCKTQTPDGTTNNEVPDDSFIPTNYNQIYAYYRTYHQLGDIDTKNISLYSKSGAKMFKVKLLEQVLLQHLTSSMVAYPEFIDKASRKTAGYGNLFVKIVDGRPYPIHPLNIVYDNSADDIQDTSIALHIKLKYHEAIEKYPKFEEEITELYSHIEQHGYNDIYIVEFYSWFKFGNKVHKGVAHFLNKNPEFYPETGLRRIKEELQLEDGIGAYEDYVEMAVEKVKRKRKDIFGNVQELFPIEVSEAFPLDDGIRSQGIIELLMPLQARINQLLERFDRLTNSSLSGVKLLETEPGFESDIDEQDIRNMKPDEVLAIMRGKQDLRSIVDQSVVQESQAILNQVAFIKNMMNEISGVTNFALSAELSGSAKATTSAAISTASQTPFKKFVERMAQFHQRLLRDFILPDLIENGMDKEVILENVPQNVKLQILREAAENEVSRNWEKYRKEIWNERKEAAKANPSVVVYGPGMDDYEREVDKLVEKNSSKAISFKISKDWIEKLSLDVIVDIDDEYADKERKFNQMMQISQLPVMQQVLKIEEVAKELLRNSDVDNYDFIKTKQEQINDARQEAQNEVFKNQLAQQVASLQGPAGEMGGRPVESAETRQRKAEAKIGETEGVFEQANPAL